MARNGSFLIKTKFIFKRQSEVSKFASEVYQLSYDHILPTAFGIGGVWNLLIIIYFVKVNFRRLKKMSSYHFLVIHLALTDLLTCTSSAIFPQYVGQNWQMGEFMCIIILAVGKNIVPMVSTITLIFISYSRYRVIVHPFQPKISKTKAALMCLAAWALACLSHIHSLMNSKLQRGYGPVCQIIMNMEQFLTKSIVQHIFDSFVPLGIMFYLYYKIQKSLNAEQNSNNFQLTDQSRQRNQTALRTVRGLIFLFAITVIPVRCLALISLAFGMYAFKSRPLFSTMLFTYNMLMDPIMIFTLNMNYVLNIFIYAKMIPGFRKFLLTVFTLGMYGGCGQRTVA